MPIWKASFLAPIAEAEKYAEALSEAFAPEASAVSTSEVEEHVTWRIDALYEEEPEADAILALLANAGATPEAGISEFTLAPLPDEDWVKKSLEGLAPVQAGRFFVYGSHDAHKVPAGVIPLLIEAGQAFGTGHHGTTEGCLAYISEICAARTPSNPLDLGTGTGVLAIGIAKLTHHPVLASDIDPVATRVARENAAGNGVKNLVRIVTATGFGHPLLTARAPYDLIVANILARPLVAMAPAFAVALAPGGDLVLSGILRKQGAMVTAACVAQGLKLVSRKPIDDWVTLRFTR
ncbi:MAG: 50S ribosomal protein L11 methyltransferase [Parvibaculaceae bacterium]|nr:50S ribosomal protein L11 methyltransferase [Parvibaculaceae bacterium]